MIRRHIDACAEAYTANQLGDVEQAEFWNKEANRVHLGGKTIGDGLTYISAVVETATSATVTIEDPNNNLEQLLEPTGSIGEFIVKITDPSGDELYGWVSAVAKTSNAYTLDVYNTPALATQSWVGTLANHDLSLEESKFEIYQNSSSVVWTTGTILTREVAYDPAVSDFVQLSAFSNGDFAVDYHKGRVLYKKATTGTSDTLTYSVRADSVVVSSTSGAATTHVEDAAHASGDAGSMSLAVRNDALAALATTDGDYAPLQVSAAGALYSGISEVLGATISATNPVFVELTDGTAVISSTNPLTTQISDGTTGVPVNTAFALTEVAAQASLMTTGLMMGWNNAGSSLSALEVNVDNAETSGTPNVLSIGGVYKATLDTYDDNDASPLHVNSGGELLVQAKGYDTGTDSVKTFEVSPITDQHVETTLLSDVAIASGTTDYVYSDLDGYKYAAYQIVKSGAGTATFTLEATLQDDGTAAASCTYVDVTLALTGAATASASTMWLINVPSIFKYLRVKYVTAGGVVSGIIIYAKKVY